MWCSSALLDKALVEAPVADVGAWLHRSSSDQHSFGALRVPSWDTPPSPSRETPCATRLGRYSSGLFPLGTQALAVHTVTPICWCSERAWPSPALISSAFAARRALITDSVATVGQSPELARVAGFGAPGPSPEPALGVGFGAPGPSPEPALVCFGAPGHSPQLALVAGSSSPGLSLDPALAPGFRAPGQSPAPASVAARGTLLHRPS